MKKEFKKDTFNKTTMNVISQVFKYHDYLNGFLSNAKINDFGNQYWESITGIINYLRINLENLENCILKEPYKKSSNIPNEYLQMLDSYRKIILQFDLYTNNAEKRTIEDLKTALLTFLITYISFFEEYHKYDSALQNKSKLKGNFHYVDEIRKEKDKYIEVLEEINTRIL